MFFAGSQGYRPSAILLNFLPPPHQTPPYVPPLSDHSYIPPALPFRLTTAGVVVERDHDITLGRVFRSNAFREPSTLVSRALPTNSRLFSHSGGLLCAVRSLQVKRTSIHSSLTPPGSTVSTFPPLTLQPGSPILLGAFYSSILPTFRSFLTSSKTTPPSSKFSPPQPRSFDDHPPPCAVPIPSEAQNMVQHEWPLPRHQHLSTKAHEPCTNLSDFYAKQDDMRWRRPSCDGLRWWWYSSLASASVLPSRFDDIDHHDAPVVSEPVLRRMEVASSSNCKTEDIRYGAVSKPNGTILDSLLEFPGLRSALVVTLGDGMQYPFSLSSRFFFVSIHVNPQLSTSS
ncbi:hypothetical protein D9758_015881 [Tetrapyrgos nigripes]|uniref:Uncharacterized protein n=1 Tax=Tetrapyrgos nigripes TaxID=182062 RepID=A0A8H5CLB8_9AGAR|nr:hypothetical protein D9758_015881 [Tetrapyrgos nigripes]